MSEKTVLSYFIYFCEYCLELLKLKTQIAVLNKLSIDYKYNDCQFDFYIQEVVLKLKNDEWFFIITIFNIILIIFNFNIILI